MVFDQERGHLVGQPDCSREGEALIDRRMSKEISRLSQIERGLTCRLSMKQLVFSPGICLCILIHGMDGGTMGQILQRSADVDVGDIGGATLVVP
jgi:hypothetical protein